MTVAFIEASIDLGHLLASQLQLCVHSVEPSCDWRQATAAKKPAGQPDQACAACTMQTQESADHFGLTPIFPAGNAMEKVPRHHLDRPRGDNAWELAKCWHMTRPSVKQHRSGAGSGYRDFVEMSANNADPAFPGDPGVSKRKPGAETTPQGLPLWAASKGWLKSRLVSTKIAHLALTGQLGEPDESARCKRRPSETFCPD